MLAQAPPVQSVRGLVVDAKTTAAIADARVLLAELGRSVQTGADGRFDFGNVEPGTYTLTVSFIGYTFVHRTIRVGRSALDLTIPLAEGTGAYQENVTVSAATSAPTEVGVASQSELGSAGLQDLRGVAADDPMRAMQALPGVTTGDDFQSLFSVRGSAFRHVGIVIDGTATPLLLHTIRNVNDTGSIAMVNTDVLGSASLLAGPHPQRQGDWLGATLDFGMREGSRDRAQFRGNASATSASAVIEGPLGRSKRGSWIAAVRKSYIDWLIRKIDPSIDSTLGFYDAQGKLAYDLGSRQQVQLLFIGGNATLQNYNASRTNGLYTASSKSVLASSSWRYTRPSLVLMQRVSFIANRFNDLGLSSQELGHGYVRALVWRGDTTWLMNKAWTMAAGAKTESQHETLTERTFTLVGGLPVQRFVASSVNHTTLASGWGELSYRTGTHGLSAGSRVTTDSLSGSTVASPWVLAEQRLGPFAFRLGGGVSHQFPELELQRAITDRYRNAPARSTSASITNSRAACGGRSRRSPMSTPTSSAASARTSW